MIRAIVVEDEAPSRQAICNYLNSYCKEVEVVATASTVKTAFRTIDKNKPDVVFLDIELPDGSGFDLLRHYNPIPFHVVFITAYSEYAVKAFRVNALDYLLKPIKIEELQNAIAKIRVGINTLDSAKLSALTSTIKNEFTPEPIMILSNFKGHDVVRINDIVMCKADGYCTIFHLLKNKTITTSKNLKQYEDFLLHHFFIRVHHSYLINIQHVTGFTKQGVINLSENNKAYLGDKYKGQFLKLITSI